MTKAQCALRVQKGRSSARAKEPEPREAISVTALAMRLAETIDREYAIDTAEGRSRDPAAKNRLSVLAGLTSMERDALEKLICATRATTPDEELMQIILTFFTLDVMESAEELRSTEPDRARNHFALERLITARRATSALPASIFRYYGRIGGAGDETSDPHPEWWSEVQRLEQEENALSEANNEAKADALSARRWELLWQLCRTPARTLDGAWAQADCLAQFFTPESSWTKHPDQVLARTLETSLLKLSQRQ